MILIVVVFVCFIFFQHKLNVQSRKQKVSFAWLSLLLHFTIVLFVFFQYVAASSGIGEGDLVKLSQILEAVPEVSYICIDVANGYSEHFVQFVRDVRKKFPNHTIMVG